MPNLTFEICEERKHGRSIEYKPSLPRIFSMISRRCKVSPSQQLSALRSIKVMRKKSFAVVRIPWARSAFNFLRCDEDTFTSWSPDRCWNKSAGAANGSEKEGSTDHFSSRNWVAFGGMCDLAACWKSLQKAWVCKQIRWIEEESTSEDLSNQPHLKKPEGYNFNYNPC